MSGFLAELACARSTAAKYDRYSSCWADQPFWARPIT
jgi:hypothetical protein